jgi:hypothetical protein
MVVASKIMHVPWVCLGFLELAYEVEATAVNNQLALSD